MGDLLPGVAVGSVHVEAVESPPPNQGNPFHPYPNENSWRIGDWYWNHGVKKSKKGFNGLMEIIASPDFRPEDLCHTNWSTIDRELGHSGIRGASHSVPPNHEETDSQLEDWLTEGDGWLQRSITISVPFPRRSLHPGPRNYTISNFYRRSLLSIIREVLSDPLRCRSFRFEPYLLRWKNSHMAVDMGVYGELFYSEAFVTAHRQLQEIPLDPSTSDSTLPRRIVALMFWSDATHLTSFGDAKLWPLYLHFGNESKYQRCAPNANLCSHAAYFQTVSVIDCQDSDLIVFSNPAT
jgi:Plavaka transposase